MQHSWIFILSFICTTTIDNLYETILQHESITTFNIITHELVMTFNYYNNHKKSILFDLLVLKFQTL